MMMGSMPFKADTIEALHNKILTLDYDPHKKPIPPQSQNLIRKMQVLDPDERYSIEQVLDHPWLSSVHIPQSQAKKYADTNHHNMLDEQVISRIVDLGFKEEFVKESVQAEAQNHPNVCYHTLIKALDK